MGGGLDFGMTGGVATLLCAPLFPPYLLFPHPRRLGRKMFGTFLEGEVRIPVPLRGRYGLSRRMINLQSKSLYKALEPERQGEFPSSVIWNPWVSLRVGFFAWEATWNKVLTLDQIQRRG
ncbi:hypothetical protein CK203_025933 [Vitis vinifera]|uniref:Reverse transcriptase zinc-binding domain-containing protein n=1 Tax=Vitis vinifera TaxID=29760 RepID=A0A438IL10_VITVI|nr:hypothetical protein CK203_025933 [Vitis vinifera]